MRRPALKQNFIASSIDAPGLSRLISQIWLYLKEVLDPVLSRPRAITNVLDVTLTYAVDGGGNPIPNVINHLLTVPTGKTPEGWCVVDKDANTDIYRSDWDEKTISLITSTTTTNIRLEVW